MEKAGQGAGMHRYTHRFDGGAPWPAPLLIVFVLEQIFEATPLEELVEQHRWSVFKAGP